MCYCSCCCCCCWWWCYCRMSAVATVWHYTCCHWFLYMPCRLVLHSPSHVYNSTVQHMAATFVRQYPFHVCHAICFSRMYFYNFVIFVYVVVVVFYYCCILAILHVCVVCHCNCCRCCCCYYCYWHCFCCCPRHLYADIFRLIGDI